MKLSIKGVALAGAIVWGLGMCLVTIGNTISPGYAVDFLTVMGSIYPGFEYGQGANSIIVGTLYGVVDAGIAGAVFAWLYNCLAR